MQTSRIISDQIVLEFWFSFRCPQSLCNYFFHQAQSPFWMNLTTVFAARPDVSLCSLYLRNLLHPYGTIYNILQWNNDLSCMYNIQLLFPTYAAATEDAR
uniref:Uncharacterized protein n=1 Tax=Micrurus lemniscatus lemniscatus TaxID=129467 RepID=A0A2D4JC32_MICLE